MAFFKDIPTMDDHTIQKMLARVDSFTCALAMLDAEDAVKQKIYQNMSEQAARMIQEEIDVLSTMDARRLVIEMNRAHVGSILSDLEQQASE